MLYENQNRLSQKKTESIVHIARELDELRTGEREEEIERRDAKERFKRNELDQAELFHREKLVCIFYRLNFKVLFLFRLMIVKFQKYVSNMKWR